MQYILVLTKLSSGGLPPLLPRVGRFSGPRRSRFTVSKQKRGSGHFMFVSAPDAQEKGRRVQGIIPACTRKGLLAPLAPGISARHRRGPRRSRFTVSKQKRGSGHFMFISAPDAQEKGKRVQGIIPACGCKALLVPLAAGISARHRRGFSRQSALELSIKHAMSASMALSYHPPPLPSPNHRLPLPSNSLFLRGPRQRWVGAIHCQTATACVH